MEYFLSPNSFIFPNILTLSSNQSDDYNRMSGSSSNKSNYDPFSTPSNSTNSTSTSSRRNLKSSSTKSSAVSKSSNKVTKVRVKRVRKYTSCENCIEKKIKCDRSNFCSGCAMRGLNCFWVRGKPNLPISERDALRAAKIEIEQLQSKITLLESRLTVQEDRHIDHNDKVYEKEAEEEEVTAEDIDEDDSDVDIKPQISLSPSPVLEESSITYPESPLQYQQHFELEDHLPHSPVGRPQLYHRPHSYVNGLYSPPTTPQYQDSDFSHHNNQPKFVALSNLEKSKSNSSSNSFDDYVKQISPIHHIQKSHFGSEQLQNSDQMYYQVPSSSVLINDFNPYPTPPTPQSQGNHFNFSASEIDNRFSHNNNVENNFDTTSGFNFYPNYDSNRQTYHQVHQYPEPRALQFPPQSQLNHHHQIDSYPYSNERGSIEDVKSYNGGLGMKLGKRGEARGGIVNQSSGLVGRSFFKPNYTFGFQVESTSNYVNSVIPGELEIIEENVMLGD